MAFFRPTSLYNYPVVSTKWTFLPYLPCLFDWVFVCTPGPHCVMWFVSSMLRVTRFYREKYPNNILLSYKYNKFNVDRFPNCESAWQSLRFVDVKYGGKSLHSKYIDSKSPKYLTFCQLYNHPNMSIAVENIFFRRWADISQMGWPTVGKWASPVLIVNKPRFQMLADPLQ